MPYCYEASYYIIRKNVLGGSVPLNNPLYLKLGNNVFSNATSWIGTSDITSGENTVGETIFDDDSSSSSSSSSISSQSSSSSSSSSRSSESSSSSSSQSSDSSSSNSSSSSSSSNPIAPVPKDTELLANNSFDFAPNPASDWTLTGSVTGGENWTWNEGNQNIESSPTGYSSVT